MIKLLVTFFVVSLPLQAASLHTGVIKYIDYPRNAEESTLLYVSDGYVLKLDQAKKNIADFELAKEQQLVLEFNVDDGRIIQSVRVMGKKDAAYDDSSLLGSYEPTVLKTLQEAKNIFSKLRKGATSWSQCYNRAHVWAYESKKSFNLDSMKVFMFYTRKYIREYNFGWWFHVAPFTYVMEEDGKTERVLDFKFTKEPTKIKNWTDIFMRNKVSCPVITRYSQYENHQEEQYCYLYKASMYYLQPLDLENLEETGASKDKWLDYEVKRAYRNGFGIWL